MPISHWILPQASSRVAVLALLMSQGLAVPASGETVLPKSDGREVMGEIGFFASATELVAALVQAITTTPWKGVAIGPEIVTGEASCSRSADGQGIDCAAAALAVCARAGFHEGFEVSTATRRVCRGSATLTGTGDERADCKAKTAIARAVCW